MSRYKKMIKLGTIILASLIAIYIALLVYDTDDKKQDEVQLIVINDIAVNDIAAVGIAHDDVKFGLIVDGTNIVLEPNEEQHNYSLRQMQAFIYSLSKMHAIREIEGDAKSFGLDNPKSAITIFKTDGSKVKLILGGLNPVDDSYYLSKDDKIYGIENEVGRLLKVTTADFYEKALLPNIDSSTISKIETISIWSKDNSDRAFMLTNNGDYTFDITEPIKNVTNIDNVFSDIILPLSAIYPEEVVDTNGSVAEYGIDNPEFEINIIMDGQDYTLAVGKVDEEYYINKQGDETIFKIDAEQIAFLKNDYLDIVADGVYNCNVTRVSDLVLEDLSNDKDYNISVTGEGTEVSAVFDGNIVEYQEFMTFYNKINAMGKAGQIKDIEVKDEPYFTITLQKENGTNDRLEFFEAENDKSMLSVNGVFNFEIYDTALNEIILELEKLSGA